MGCTNTCCESIEEKHYGDIAARPDLFGIIIPGKRGKILTKVYTAAGEGKHPVVVMTHGIPGNDQNVDIAHFLRRQGFNVVQFHYSGCWGSDGDYSLAHNLEDTETVMNFVLNDEKFNFDKDHIYAIGHSLGGFTCGHLLANHKEIKAGVLLMPCDIGRMPVIQKENETLYKEFEALLDESADFLHGTSKEALITEAFEHSDEYRLESVAPKLTATPILMFTGSLDYVIPDAYFCKPTRDAVAANGGTKMEHIEYPTDHFFLDYRQTIENDICNFFKRHE